MEHTPGFDQGDGTPQTPSEPTRILPQVPMGQPSPGQQETQSQPEHPEHPEQPAPPSQYPPAAPSQYSPAQQVPPSQYPPAPPSQYSPQPQPLQPEAPYQAQAQTPQPPTQPPQQPPVYQQYGPAQPPQWAAQPPVPPQKKGKAWVAVLVAILLVVLLAGAAGAFVALRKKEAPEQGASTQQPAGGVQGAESGGLKITFKSAETRYYKMEYIMDGTITGIGLLADDSGPAHVSMTMSSDITLQVVDRLPGGVTKIKMTMANTQMTMNVNGEAETLPNELSEEMEIVYRVNPDGTFEMESASAAGSPFPSTSPFGATGGSGSSPFGFNGPAPLLPDHPVKPGDTWSKSIETKAPGFTKPLRIDTANTYERDESTQWGKAMVILSRADTTLDFSTLDASGLGAPAGVKYSGMVKVSVITRFWFVPELGEAVKQVVDPSSKMEGTMQFQVADQAPPGSGGSPGMGPMKISMDMRLGMTLDRQVSPPPSASKPKTPAVSS
jgi:hypothetical protein